jgi:hypothetical protein
VIVYRRDGGTASAEELVAAGMAAAAYRSKTFGVFPYIHNGISVEYHPREQIAYVEGGDSVYFGFNATVDMRCWCRRVIFDEAGFGTDNYRSAAFLTDGTELASVPIVKSVIQNPPFEIYTESNRFFNNWFGGMEQPLYDRYVHYEAGNKYTLSGSIPFEVPDDACLPEPIFGGGFYYLGDDAQTSYYITRDNSVPSFILSYVSYGGFYSKQFNGAVNQDIQMSVLVDVVDNQIKPALQREYKRRKRCSDGQMAYLRNGFMSPEIERFVKAYHPVSALIRRDIPMQIVSEPVHTLINEERNADGALIASTYECKVTLKYETADGDGVITQHEKEFTGQVRFTKYTATYTNYPLLGEGLNGGATFVYTEFGSDDNLKHVIMMFWIYYRTGRQIVHDEKSDISSLFCELNGTLTNNERWNPTDEFFHGGANYVPGEAIQSSYGDLNISHPQFLLDYIAASKPIETELDAGGNKVPVKPSTDWLSSRLTDKEIVRVVPIHHIGSNYGSYGMFPLPNFNSSHLYPIDNDVNELRIFGYAEFQYNADTASFAFKKWVELTSDGKVTIGFDDEYTLDDESNPAIITITSNGAATSYNLAPKSFAYDPSWGSTNCVCIGNKVIWSDIKADAKEQKINIADTAPEGYELTDEERLYHEVRKAIK